MSNQVGDSPKLQIDPKVLLMPLDVSVLADLQDGDNPINNPILSGKCLGGLVYLPATKDIAIACGDLHTSAWRLCSTGATHTPSAATAFSSTIGDGRRKHKHVPIVATGIPNFISNELAAASSDVNTHNLSGKDIGALLVTTTGVLYMAQGNTPTSKWQSLVYDSSDITPTGDARDALTNSLTGDKPRPITSRIALPHLGYNLIPITAELSDEDSVINNKYLSGKRLGSMCLAYYDATGVLAVAIANGSEPTDTWSLLATSTTITPA